MCGREKHTRLAGGIKNAVNVELAALRGVKARADVAGSALKGGSRGESHEGSEGESGELHCKVVVVLRCGREDWRRRFCCLKSGLLDVLDKRCRVES